MHIKNRKETTFQLYRGTEKSGETSRRKRTLIYHIKGKHKEKMKSIFGHLDLK